MPGAKNIKQLVDGNDSIFSKCDSATCNGILNGIFTTSLNQNFFLLPSYFNFKSREEFFVQAFILSLNKKQFDVLETKKMVVDVSEGTPKSKAFIS